MHGQGKRIAHVHLPPEFVLCWDRYRAPTPTADKGLEGSPLPAVALPPESNQLVGSSSLVLEEVIIENGSQIQDSHRTVS